MSTDAANILGTYTKHERQSSIDYRRTSPHTIKEEQQLQQHQALDPYSQYKPYEHQPVDPFALIDGYRQDPSTAAQSHHDSSNHNTASAYANFPNIPGANGPVPIDRRTSLTENVIGSPASSYAPSLGPDTRNNSLAHVHYPQQQQQGFKVPSNVALDRRMSSPAAMHQQTAFAAANGASRLAARSGIAQDQGPQWTPNFSFGGGGGGNNTNSNLTGNNSNTGQGGQSGENNGAGMGAIPEHFVSTDYMNQGRPSYPSLFGGSGYSTDRRMSVPVLPTGSFQTSPNARPMQGRHVPAVDWSAYESSLIPQTTSRQEFYPRETLPGAGAGYLDSLGSAAARYRNQANNNVNNNPALVPAAPYDHMKSHLQKRRQSLPFFPPDGAALGGLQPDGSGGLLQPPSMMMEEGHQVSQQQSMMSTFHAKDENASHKKHVCPICKKRFTRPSSLTTHIYSHTGEKPFVCEVPGCGRHFSVISNLRRHKKIHQNGGGSIGDGGASDENEAEVGTVTQPPG